MKRNDRILQLVRLWVLKIGASSARKRLVARDFGIATAEKITRGAYESTPGNHFANILLDEMIKDGIVLIDENTPLPYLSEFYQIKSV